MDTKYVKYKNKYLELQKKSLEYNNFKGGFLERYFNNNINLVDINNELLTLLSSNSLYKKKNITNHSLIICKDLSFIKSSSFSIFDIQKKVDIIEKTYNSLITYTDENYVEYYYSVPNKIFLINYIISKLEKNKNSLLRSKKFKFLFKNAQDCLDNIKIIIDNINISDSNNDEKLIDKRPEYRSHLISTNLSLFGNEFFSDKGESTLNYYLNKASQLSYDLNTLLDEFLFKYYIKLKFNKKTFIINMLEKINDIEYSTIYQILIPKDSIEKYTYLSYEYGKPFNNDTNEIKKFIDLYLNKQFNELNIFIEDTKKTLLSTKFYNRILDNVKIGHNYCNPINLIQSRIVISQELIDNNKIIINYYNMISADIIKEINELCDILINENEKDIKEICNLLLTMIINKFKGKNDNDTILEIIKIINDDKEIDNAIIKFLSELFINMNDSEVEILIKHLFDNNVNIKIIEDNLHLYYYYYYYYQYIIHNVDELLSDDYKEKIKIDLQNKLKKYNNIKDALPYNNLYVTNEIIFNYSLIITCESFKYTGFLYEFHNYA